MDICEHEGSIKLYKTMGGYSATLEPAGWTSFELLSTAAKTGCPLRCVFHPELQFDEGRAFVVALKSLGGVSLYGHRANAGDSVQYGVTLLCEAKEFQDHGIVG
jgi:hypothetical protein